MSKAPSQPSPAGHDKRHIGERLRVTRRALSIVHDVPEWNAAARFAEHFGLSPQRYSSYEVGDAYPNPNFLHRLWKDYGVTSDWILHGDKTGLRGPLLMEIEKLQG